MKHVQASLTICRGLWGPRNYGSPCISKTTSTSVRLASQGSCSTMKLQAKPQTQPQTLRPIASFEQVEDVEADFRPTSAEPPAEAYKDVWGLSSTVLRFRVSAL